MRAWDFILYSCVSLALKDKDLLRQLLALPVKTEGYARVTVEWFGMHKAILLDEVYSSRQCKKTKGEERFFKALTSMINKTEPD